MLDNKYPHHPSQVSLSEADSGPVVASESLAGSRLALGQIDTLMQYVQEATDKIVAPGDRPAVLGGWHGSSDYQDGRKVMDATSERIDADSEIGRLAILAATLGAAARNPVTLAETVGLLAEVVAIGVDPGHVTIFQMMQADFALRPTPSGIGDALKSGLVYLKGREERFGEDVSKPRLFFMISALAATKDADLRQAIVKDLR